MRLVIGLCGWCRIPKGECIYRAHLRLAIKEIKFNGTLTHKCPKYYEQIPIYSKVRIELKELDVGERGGDHLEPPEPYAEWVSAGKANGMVIKHSKRGFFVIELDRKVELTLPPEKGDSWLMAKPTMVSLRMKRSNDIEIISIPDGKDLPF
jgi:hypothetical protein